MNNNIDLKTLWNRQETTMPNEKEIFAKANKIKNEIRKKSIFIVLVLLLTIAVILLVWFNVNLQMLTSKIGITLIIMAIVLAILDTTKSLISPTNKNIATDNKIYLAQFLKLKQQQHFTQKILMNVYFTLLSIGLALYMYEPTLRMNTMSMALTYSITFAWIAFNWLYLRPKTAKKQQAKLNEIIEKLQNLNNNLATPE